MENMVSDNPEKMLSGYQEFWFYLDPIFPLVAVYDLCNFFVLSLFILYCYKKKIINFPLSVFIILNCATVWIFNGFLFDWHYMPDQNKYFRAVQAIRDFEPLENTLSPWGRKLHQGVVIQVSSWIYAFIPLPFVETYNSLGFFNKFIYFACLIFLYKKKWVNDYVLIFYIFYPTALLYTGLSLRDPLVLVFTILSLITLVRGYYLYSLFFLVFLLYTKIIAGIVFGLIGIFYILIFKIRPKTVRIFATTIFVLLIFLLVTNDLQYGLGVLEVDSKDPLSYLNTRRANLFLENVGYRSGAYATLSPMEARTEYGFKTLNFDLTSLLVLLKSTVYFIFSPLPWDVKNHFIFIVFVENILVLSFFIFVCIECYGRNYSKAIFWMLSLLFICTVYGTMVFNVGTISRYKFTILLPIIIAMSIDCKFYKKIKIFKGFWY